MSSNHQSSRGRYSSKTWNDFVPNVMLCPSLSNAHRLDNIGSLLIAPHLLQALSPACSNFVSSNMTMYENPFSWLPVTTSPGVLWSSRQMQCEGQGRNSYHLPHSSPSNPLELWRVRRYHETEGPELRPWIKALKPSWKILVYYVEAVL